MPNPSKSLRAGSLNGLDCYEAGRHAPVAAKVGAGASPPAASGKLLSGGLIDGSEEIREPVKPLFQQGGSSIPLHVFGLPGVY